MDMPAYFPEPDRNMKPRCCKAEDKRLEMSAASLNFRRSRRPRAAVPTEDSSRTSVFTIVMAKAVMYPAWPTAAAMVTSSEPPKPRRNRRVSHQSDRTASRSAESIIAKNLDLSRVIWRGVYTSARPSRRGAMEVVNVARAASASCGRRTMGRWPRQQVEQEVMLRQRGQVTVCFKKRHFFLVRFSIFTPFPFSQGILHASGRPAFSFLLQP